MSQAKGRSSPLPVDELATKRDCPDINTEEGKAEIEELKKKDYRALIGALLWIHRSHLCTKYCILGTSPKHVLSQPRRQKHWKQALGILRYLKHHVDNNDPHADVSSLGLKFVGTVHDKSWSWRDKYVDASFADNYGDETDNRRSTTGWCFQAGGSVLSSKAQKQSTAATHS
jgi:hypothetical protein